MGHSWPETTPLGIRKDYSRREKAPCGRRRQVPWLETTPLGMPKDPVWLENATLEPAFFAFLVENLHASRAFGVNLPTKYVINIAKQPILWWNLSGGVWVFIMTANFV